MRYDVRILRRAQTDLEEIVRYVRRDRPRAAERILASLLDDIASLDASPGRGALPRDRRLRALRFRVLVHGEYLVFYKILKRRVRVYRVLHGRRRFADLL